MALRWLICDEMIGISTGWITVGERARAVIEKTPLLAVLLPHLEEAHEALVDLRAKAEPDTAALSKKAGEVDARHDALVRGMYVTLTMLAPISDDSAELLGIRDQLFPEALGHTQVSYRGEAGYAKVVESHLDDAMKARLKAIVMHKKTMLDLVTVWLDSGRELGRLEDERDRLVGTSPSLGAEMQTARREWLRLAKALMANAKLAKLTSADDEALFSTLRKTERSAESRAPEKPAPAPAPAPVPAPARM